MKFHLFAILTSALTLLTGCDQSKQTLSPPEPKGQVHAQDIFKKRMGLFIHWVGSTPEHGSGILFSNGQTSKTPDEFADAVDVNKVCDEVAALGFEYVVLTDFHGFGTMLHPSAASDKWRGPGYTAKSL